MDSDTAREFLDSLLEYLGDKIREAMLPENITKSGFLLDYGEDVIMPALDIILVLCEHYTTLPQEKSDSFQIWKETYLHLYDRDIGNYTPKEAYITERRSVIENTFDRLIKLASEYD